MFGLSMLEHGAITPQMTEEAIRAVVGYLRAHLPDDAAEVRGAGRPAGAAVNT